MFGIGFGEMLVIGVLVLLAVGPDRLPTMIKTIARTYRQLRRTAQDIRSSTGIDEMLRDEELKELAELRKQKILFMQQQAPAKLGAAGKPLPAKPGASDATVPAKPAAAAKPEAPDPHAPPPEKPLPYQKPLAGEGPIEKPLPYQKPAPSIDPNARVGGLTLAQRQMEQPPEGVDIAELTRAVAMSKEGIAAREAIAAKEAAILGKPLAPIPETRVAGKPAGTPEEAA